MSDSAARELGKKSAGLSTRASVTVLALFAVGAAVTFDLIEFSPLVVAGLALLFVAVAAVSSAVEIVEAYEKEALTVFGEFRELLEPGIHFVPPFVSQTYPFDMRTQTIDVPKQEAITEDNSPVTADAVVYIKVMDAKRAFLEVDDYRRATSNLAQTTLRAVLGDMELDETLSKREKINRRIQRELEGPTDEWGVRVEAVEVREVNPSPDVQRAMEKQSSAERRRRAMILEAQGERRSAVETAEGDKQANILEAQGEKQASVLEAQGESISTVLRAKSAESMGERAIIERGMEALEEIGTSDSTTFVLPQEMTSLLSRYGKHLTGSDVGSTESSLESMGFDEETREMLGIDSIEELAAGDGDVDLEVDSADIELEDDIE
ncbi:SPFH domain-containing protein [Natronomonas sp. LN261]|jgi:regulator of protease activity HflC (stomatin/prohibitin superfamily)|uniref:SPFH domain-containing protein n=1 Tax=Natronomonas sp. LN261 TaxID=2750669 RepID=UPI0015EF65A7|nr:SPFH domain-containing protein [Natronomonas sp. LN261]